MMRAPKYDTPIGKFGLRSAEADRSEQACNLVGPRGYASLRLPSPDRAPEHENVSQAKAASYKCTSANTSSSELGALSRLL